MLLSSAYRLYKLNTAAFYLKDETFLRDETFYDKVFVTIGKI